MGRVTIQEFELFRRRLRPCLYKSPVACVDAQRSPRTDDFDWKRIKELIREDDIRRAEIAARQQGRLPGFEMSTQRDLNSLAQHQRLFHQHIAQCTIEVRKFLL